MYIKHIYIYIVISLFCICEFACWLKFTGNRQNQYLPFLQSFADNMQMGEKFE